MARSDMRVGGMMMLECLLQAAGGMTTQQLAEKKCKTEKAAYDVMRRSEAFGYVLRIVPERLKGQPKPAHVFQLTDKGRELVFTWIANGRGTKAPKPAESDEVEDKPWPRADPELVVRQAVRTQPTSVFDMPRMMWQWRG